MKRKIFSFSFMCIMVLLCFVNVYAEDTSIGPFNISNIYNSDAPKINYRGDIQVLYGNAPVVVENTKDECVCFDMMKLKYNWNLGKYEDDTFVAIDGQGIHAMNNPFYPTGNSFYPSYNKGTKYTLKEPGIYYLFGNYYPWSSGFYNEVIIVIDSIDALSTRSKIFVNGEEINLQGYNINDNNYFKLRDIATILKGTKSEFNVVWNSENNCVELESKAPYISVGGEMNFSNTNTQRAKVTNNRIIEKNEDVHIKGYNINDNNYFKLRDLGEYFDFSVDYEKNSDSIFITTGKGYKLYPDVIDIGKVYNVKPKTVSSQYPNNIERSKNRYYYDKEDITYEEFFIYKQSLIDSGFEEIYTREVAVGLLNHSTGRLVALEWSGEVYEVCIMDKKREYKEAMIFLYEDLFKNKSYN